MRGAELFRAASNFFGRDLSIVELVCWQKKNSLPGTARYVAATDTPCLITSETIRSRAIVREGEKLMRAGKQDYDYRE